MEFYKNQSGCHVEDKVSRTCDESDPSGYLVICCQILGETIMVTY